MNGYNNVIDDTRTRDLNWIHGLRPAITNKYPGYLVGTFRVYTGVAGNQVTSSGSKLTSNSAGKTNLLAPEILRTSPKIAKAYAGTGKLDAVLHIEYFRVQNYAPGAFQAPAASKLNIATNLMLEHIMAGGSAEAFDAGLAYNEMLRGSGGDTAGVIELLSDGWFRLPSPIRVDIDKDQLNIASDRPLDVYGNGQDLDWSHGFDFKGAIIPKELISDMVTDTCSADDVISPAQYRKVNAQHMAIHTGDIAGKNT